MATPTADLPGHKPRLIIEPTRGWRGLGLAEAWAHRELALFLVWRRVKVQYRQMALGPLWMLLEPVLHMVVFTFVFGTLANLPSEGLPYPVFTFTALLPWTYFSSAANQASGSLLDNMRIISKVYFPRLIVPLAAALSGLVDLTVATGVLLALLVLLGYLPGLAVLTLPLFAGMAFVAALAVGLWTSAAAVWFRDVKYGMGFLLQAWLFATPVAYAAGLVPEQWQAVYQLNPMYWVVQGFRWALVGGGQAPGPAMLPSLALLLLFLVAGAFVFRRTERSIVDVA